MQQKSATYALAGGSVKIIALAGITISLIWYLILSVVKIDRLQDTVVDQINHNNHLIQLNTQSVILLNKRLDEIEKIIRENKNGASDTKRTR
jgi:hypothetical protein